MIKKGMRRGKAKGGCLVVCSGGLDSTVALYDALAKYAKVEAVTFHYGQNHAKREGAAVRRICKEAGVPLTEIDLGFIGRHFDSSLLKGAGAVPEGNYDSKNMASTVVPFRNGIMLSVAVGLAASRKLAKVVLGNHGGDHFIYPDCRSEFIDSIGEAALLGTDGKVEVRSPFDGITKADIVKIGADLGVPFELTYSCYKGGKNHCGKCGTCRERREAFERAGVPDPTKYDGNGEWYPAKKKGGAR